MTGLAPLPLKHGDRLVIASHNRGKVAEIADLIAPFGLAVISAADLDLSEPDETGTTFEENAAIKALAAARASGLPALADDSGLAVDALGGDPGIHSARWSGPQKDFGEAMALVEAKLQERGADAPETRGARFVAVLCLASPDGANWTWRGEIDGRIVWPPRGDRGFGYDPIFLPEGHDRTFGEMTTEEKHGWRPPADPLSHRARAFARFARDLQTSG